MANQNKKRFKRPIANTVLTLDISGSMAQHITGFNGCRERKIDVLKKAAGMLIENKCRNMPKDLVGAVLFGSRANVLFKLTPPNSTWLYKRLHNIRLEGTTNMEAGLMLAITLLEQRNPRFLRNIVLLSDGIPNSSANLIPLAKKAKRYRINIHTIGFGESRFDFDETLLKSIAHTTHRGQYQHCRTLQELANTLIRFS